MNYFLATASYEHFLLQYLEYGFSLFKSLPHQIQHRYNGLISFFIGLMTKFTNNWGHNRLFYRPTSFKAIFQNTSFKTHILRPLRKWFSDSLISKQMIIGAIKVLLPKTHPSTILFTIMSIRIYSVNAYSSLTRFFVRFIHILFKFLKRLPQYFYSSTSVTFEAIVFRIFTPLLHSTPYLIKPSSAHSVFHNLSLANSGMIVNQFYTPVYITKSQLTDIWNKANKKR